MTYIYIFFLFTWKNRRKSRNNWICSPSSSIINSLLNQAKHFFLKAMYLDFSSLYLHSPPPPLSLSLYIYIYIYIYILRLTLLSDIFDRYETSYKKVRFIHFVLYLFLDILCRYCFESYYVCPYIYIYIYMCVCVWMFMYVYLK